jgi:hypothetical protein
MPTNNIIFSLATSKLSQDTVIAWIVLWADLVLRATSWPKSARD